jgi:nucleoside-diphosphate-sugar epimerase
LAETIQTRIPEFTCTYAPDNRQEIADAWPSSVDDSAARNDWNWSPQYDLDAMTEDMLEQLRTSERESGNVGA